MADGGLGDALAAAGARGVDNDLGGDRVGGRGVGRGHGSSSVLP